MLSEEHELIRQTVRQFAQTKVEAQAMEHDEKGTFNVSLLRELGNLGLIGITIPEADGGAGLDAVASLSFLTHFESISKGVIDLRDLLYFATVIGLWLAANAIVLDIKKAD